MHSIPTEEQLPLWRFQKAELYQALQANLHLDGWMDGWMGVGVCSIGCYAPVSTEVGEYFLV